jgi:hypothetical protein
MVLKFIDKDKFIKLGFEIKNKLKEFNVGLELTNC